MKTSITSSHPSILLLKKEVEKRYNSPLKTLQDFEKFCDNMIQSKLNGKTMARLWGILPGYKLLRHSTLDILSQYVGYENWELFFNTHFDESAIESTLDTTCASICTDNLNVGDIIQITWLPNRKACLKYKGENTFEVLEVANSTTLTEGDTLKFRTITVGKPLYADSITHYGEQFQSLTLAKFNGIATAFKVADGM